MQKGCSRLILLIMLCMLGSGTVAAQNPTVVIDTSLGRIVVELYPDKAPKTVENFLEYVRAGHYEGTIFHRVMPYFVIQGGGFTPALKEKPNRKPIPNEADNGLQNRRGTVAMARTPDPHSAMSQFFINLSDNASLNHKSKTQREWGYTVFGKVITGMLVAEGIAQAPTTRRAGHRNLPILPIKIKRVWVQ